MTRTYPVFLLHARVEAVTNTNHPIPLNPDRAAETAALKANLQELRSALQEVQSAGRELKELVNELQECRDTIENLSDPVPICYACKKVRDDRGCWEHFEAYFARSVGIETESSVCPECLQGRFRVVGSTRATAG
ncbi:MAG TPA: hypothetical protein VH595_13945 [Verrucomicrobiae bacterium]|nr:hypothetical protein [Verrucomicrobiae bacterium]